MAVTEESNQTCNQLLHKMIVCGPICSLPPHDNGSHSSSRFSWEDNNRTPGSDIEDFLLAIAKLPDHLTLSVQLNADGSVLIKDIETFVQLTK